MSLLPPPPPPPPPVQAVHKGVLDDREPRTRPKLMFWDRIKVLVILGAFVAMTAAYLQSKVPIMSYGEALQDQLRAKWWVLILMGLEVVRQVHYLVCERVSGYHLFWQRKVFGGWDRRMGRLNPWLRYRLQRFVKVGVVALLLMLLLAWKWDTTLWGAISEFPGNIWDNAFAPMSGMPFLVYIFFIASISLFQLVFFYAIFFVGGIDTYKPGEIRTRFTDVWGQDPVVTRVRETVDFLERPKEIEAKGGYVPGGILLWGPPGTGKTLMAEAIAGETGKPYVFVDPSAFIQTFMGVAPMKVKWLYRKLRKMSLKHGGVVVFFDEADALGNRGGAAGEEQMSSFRASQTCGGTHYISGHSCSTLFAQHVADHPAPEPTPARGLRRFIINGGGGSGSFSGALQALLTEMSGLAKPRGFITRRLRSFLGMRAKQPPKYRILHILATNRPDTLDSALLRPGRIDRKYKVGYPHSDGRRRTFEGYLNKITHELTPAQVSRLSVITPYYTGAKIKDIVNEAVIVAMREGRDVVTWPDVLRAKTLKTFGEADDWKYTHLERHQVAIHEASHAAAMYLLRKRHVIDVATIERRGDVGGFVNDIPLEERFGGWRSEIEIDVMTYLASLAGERMFFDGDNSTGVGGDLRSSTMLVTQMLAFSGMGSTVGSRGVTIPEMTGASSRPSDGVDRQFLETAMGKQIEAKLQELLGKVSSLLSEHRWFVLAIAHALETHLTITGEDVDAIFRGTPGPTLDGWVYHTDDFRLSYEAYHLAAMEAHRNHGQPDKTLPVLGLGVPFGRSGLRASGNFPPPAPPTESQR
jgi:ATP-dependent Zn protease